MRQVNNSGLISLLPEVRGKYLKNVRLSELTWFKVGGLADVIYYPNDIDDLSFFIKHKISDIDVLTIGEGTNLLVRDGGFPGVVVRLGENFSNISINDEYVDVGAGILDNVVASAAQEESLTGLEFLYGIPGTIGGAIRMNAGAFGREMKDVVIKIFVMDEKGKVNCLEAQDINFSYRGIDIPNNWIFLGCRMKAKKGNKERILKRMQNILLKRKKSQLTDVCTAGSAFLNSPNKKAWELIEQAGCRGVSIGGAKISEEHCNFLINTGNATALDIENVGEEVRKRVLKETGINLEWEICRIGVPMRKEEEQAA